MNANSDMQKLIALDGGNPKTLFGMDFLMARNLNLYLDGSIGRELRTISRLVC
jgi:hypothetical protein